LAALMVWVTNRHDVLEDRQLVAYFMVFWLIFLGLALGFSRTHTARMRIDPVYKLQNELEAQPLFAAVKKYGASEFEDFARIVLPEVLVQHKSISEAIAKARPMLTKKVQYQAQFLNANSYMPWANVVVDSLYELQKRDPQLCYQVISQPEMLASEAIVANFSEANHAAFQNAVQQVYSYMASGKSSGAPDSVGEIASHSTLVTEYRAIGQSVEERFDASMAYALDHKDSEQWRQQTPAMLCKAKLFQLESMRARPAHIAAGLLRSAGGIYSVNTF